MKRPVSVFFWIVVVSSFLIPSHAEAAGKMRIAVSAFENKVKVQDGDPSWNIGEGLAEMLTTELTKTGRFIVLERGALSDVVGEQGLGQTGLVRQETAARTGQMIGAQVIVRGAVTEFSQRVSGAAGSVSTRSGGGGAGAETAYVAIDIRLIDAATGQIIASQNATGLAPTVGFGGEVVGRRRSGVTLGGEAFFSLPIGKATRQAISRAVAFIVQKTPQEEAFLAIVKVDGDQVFINAGANESIRVGDTFVIYSKGEDLIDPSTGLKLGSSQKKIGTIEVNDVQEKFATATITNGRGIKRGDLVKNR
jgi:curli biogenesis system outer membrane secretion channel CsgG